jgi:phospho-N-acetylmuramoyl-pentapeptide-transferase
MLAKFLYQFSDYFFGFNVFRYITVRAALAAITALILSWWIGPKVIRLMHRYQIGEEIKWVCC